MEVRCNETIFLCSQLYCIVWYYHALICCRCTLCAEPPFPLLKYYVKHLKNIHLREDGTGSSVRCPYLCLNRDGSEKCFSKPSALSQHLSKAHPMWCDERNYLPHLLSAQPIAQPASSEPVWLGTGLI